MPRLFSGLEIPSEIKAELHRLQSGFDGARWIEPNDFHLTLRFAGDIDNLQAGEFSEFLSKVKFEPFELTLNGLGSFGGKKPRTVWIGVEPSTELEHLQHAHEMAAQKAGLKPESRKFIPHITLARLRGIKETAVARYLEAMGNIKLSPLTISSTALFSARPGGGGGPYAVEMIYNGSPVAQAPDGGEEF